MNRLLFEKLRRLLAVFPAGTAQVLEYWLDVSIQKREAGGKLVAPLPYVSEVVEADIAAYRALGIRNFTTFAVGMDQEYFRRYGDGVLRDYARLLLPGAAGVPYAESRIFSGTIPG